MIMGQPLPLYIMDVGRERVLDYPVGKMFSDMIILSWAGLMTALATPTGQNGNLWFESKNPDDVMYGFTTDPVDFQDQIPVSQFPQSYPDTGLLMEIYPSLKDVGRGQNPTFADQGFIKPHVRRSQGLSPDARGPIEVFIAPPKFTTLDFYMPDDLYIPGSVGMVEGVNNKHLLTYFMDPKWADEAKKGITHSTKVFIDHGANRHWMQDYNKLLQLWDEPPPFFDSINVEDISR